jgi:hypothetical protein
LATADGASAHENATASAAARHLWCMQLLPSKED